MSDAAIRWASQLSSAARLSRFSARAGRWLSRALLAQATRGALAGLPDDLLRDIGLARGDIAFVAAAVACGDFHPEGDPPRPGRVTPDL